MQLYALKRKDNSRESRDAAGNFEFSNENDVFLAVCPISFVNYEREMRLLEYF